MEFKDDNKNTVKLGQLGKLNLIRDNNGNRRFIMDDSVQIFRSRCKTGDNF
jgi:hypothetical protein